MTLAELLRRRYELLFKKDYARSPRYAKWVTHRISPLFVWLFSKTGTTPDQTTLLAFVCGVIGAVLFSVPEARFALAGALAVELYYVLDAVDGQLARYTKKYSKSGSFFDVIGNYIVPPLVWIGIGVGQAAAGAPPFFFWFSASAALGSVWLSVMWDVRSTVLFESLKREGASLRRMPSGSGGAGAPSAAGRAFSLLHKICTYPTVMNVLTLTAVAQFAMNEGNAFHGWAVLFYGALIPFVALTKIAKLILSREIDAEFDAYARPLDG